MMIDQVLPHAVGDHGALKDQLFQHAREQGLSVEQATERFAGISAPLIDAGTFLDKLTGLWRYEFGVPFEIDGTLVWGSHMWVPVDHLHRAIVTANARLSEPERATYYARLNDPERHAVTHAEMIPGSKVRADHMRYGLTRCAMTRWASNCGLRSAMDVESADGAHSS